MSTKKNAASGGEAYSKVFADFEELFRLENEALDADLETLPFFSEGDLIDPNGFASVLIQSSDPASSFLRKKIKKMHQDIVEQIKDRSADPEYLQTCLIDFLNRALKWELIHKQKLYEDIRLCEDTWNRLKGYINDKTRPHLNRLLLEKAYPEHLRRYNPWSILSLDHTEEPWVAFTAKDRVGLALSGGGIRSATFNLGILQALGKYRILNRIHYLSTVSGGGYIGGFWTRWRKWIRSLQAVLQTDSGCADAEERTELPDSQRRRKGPEADVFPQSRVRADDSAQRGPKETREPREFRHLREFSRFLIPRRGLNAEFWSAVSTILTGLLPSLIAAVMAVCLSMALWVLSAAALIHWYGIGAISLFTAVIAIVLAATEVMTYLSGRSAVCKSMHCRFTAWYVIWSFLAVVFFFVGCLVFKDKWLETGKVLSLNPIELGFRVESYQFNWFIFAPSIMLLFAFAVLTVMRMICGRIKPAEASVLSALERVMARILALLAFWAILSGVWEIARWLNIQAKAHQLSVEVHAGVGGVTAVLTLLFYWARRWLTQPKKDQADLKILDRLKPFVPQILANTVLLLMYVLVSVFIVNSGLCNGLWPNGWIFIACTIILILVLLLFDPAKFGQHEFYRSRLARCYLGAGRQQQSGEGACHPGQNAPDDNRMPVERPDDDMRLCDDDGLPIHLVCCAANHFWGDPLSTLHRGARSAVLSRFGIALGDRWLMDRDLRLSSAITASAAAFNSLMGEMNMQWGRAVSFVMTALNLRLGLWVRNPASRHVRLPVHRWCPGWFFVKEMLGWAQCRTDDYAGAYMHLSDGGHFENLALYELIRRHCRYIIVSDAGADGDFEFTDFGRAIRRVREDFGVEIEIDPTPLRPTAAGLSKQHIAVGAIHYDGVMGMDKGTIIYFKPTLTGDEPVDVQQYHQRNPHFPHESTVDQFFDEAQFESYRRLGEHTANSSLRMLEWQYDDLRTPADGRSSNNAIKHPTPPNIESLFRSIRLYWYDVPWMRGDAGVLLCQHVVDFEAALHDQASPDLRREFIGEIPAAAIITPPGSPGSHSALPATDADQIAKDVLLAIRAFRLMEEAWVVCQLDRYSSNPRAQSWMSYLQRLAAMPTLRKWWPVLRPMFGADFQTFASCDLYLQPDVQPGVDSRTLPSFMLVPGNTSGYASCRHQECFPGFPFGMRAAFSLLLTLPSVRDRKESVVQVGLAIIRIDQSKGVVTWTLDDLFVPPELSGGGLHSEMLDRLIKYFEDLSKRGSPLKKLEVTLPDASSDAAIRLRRTGGRQERLERIDFYRSRRFEFDGAHWNKEGQNDRMVRTLESQLPRL